MQITADNMHSITVLIVLVAGCVLFSATGAAKLPKYFKQCKRDDPQLDVCIKQSAIAGISDFVKGDPEHHVAKMMPLHVSEMLINVNGNLNIKLKDSDCFGLDTVEFQKMSWNFDKKRFETDVKYDHNTVIGTYDMKGKIMILPINGDGHCNITYVNPVYHFYFEYDIQEKNGKEYVNIVKNGMTYTLDRAYFHFENLFNGDKGLGDEMSLFLNENWKEVNAEVGAKVGDALGEVMAGVLQNFFAVVPLKELFA